MTVSLCYIPTHDHIPSLRRDTDPPAASYLISCCCKTKRQPFGSRQGSSYSRIREVFPRIGETQHRLGLERRVIL